jgi:hypothetical protein
MLLIVFKRIPFIQVRLQTNMSKCILLLSNLIKIIVLATSGIDYDIKIWQPLLENSKMNTNQTLNNKIEMVCLLIN